MWFGDSFTMNKIKFINDLLSAIVFGLIFWGKGLPVGWLILYAVLVVSYLVDEVVLGQKEGHVEN